MRLLTADFMRFTGSGFGTARGDTDDLSVGDQVYVTDEEADVLLTANVLAARPGEVDVRVDWDSATR